MIKLTQSMIKKIIVRQFPVAQLENSQETILWIDVLVLAIAERNRDPLFFEDGRCETICGMIGLEYPVIEMILNKIDEIRQNNPKLWGSEIQEATA